jgi:hypothetical protein
MMNGLQERAPQMVLHSQLTMKHKGLMNILMDLFLSSLLPSASRLEQLDRSKRKGTCVVLVPFLVLEELIGSVLRKYESHNV